MKQFRRGKADQPGGVAVPLVHMRRLRRRHKHLLLVMVITVQLEPHAIGIYVHIQASKGLLGMRLVQLQIARSIGEPPEKVVRPEP